MFKDVNDCLDSWITIKFLLVIKRKLKGFVMEFSFLFTNLVSSIWSPYCLFLQPLFLIVNPWNLHKTLNILRIDCESVLLKASLLVFDTLNSISTYTLCEWIRGLINIFVNTRLHHDTFSRSYKYIWAIFFLKAQILFY